MPGLGFPYDELSRPRMMIDPAEGHGAVHGGAPGFGMGIAPGEWDWQRRLGGFGGVRPINFDPSSVTTTAATAPIKQPENLVSRLRGGLGRFRERFGEVAFPGFESEAMGLTPEQVKQARALATMRMGLGMLASVGTGANFGQSVLHGLGQASEATSGSLNNAFRNRLLAGNAARARRAEERAIASDEWTRAHTQQREGIEDQRYATGLTREDTQRTEDAQLRRDLAKVAAGSRIDVANIRANRPPKPWGLKASDSNAIMRNAATMFGGFYDPISGQFAGLDAERAQKALGLAEEAERLFAEGGGKVGVNDATAEAARRFGIGVPSAGSGPTSRVRRYNSKTRQFDE